MSKKQREKVEDEVRMHKQLQEHGVPINVSQASAMDIASQNAYDQYSSTLSGSDYSASSM